MEMLRFVVSCLLVAIGTYGIFSYFPERVKRSANMRFQRGDIAVFTKEWAEAEWADDHNQDTVIILSTDGSKLVTVQMSGSRREQVADTWLDYVGGPQ